MPRQRLEIGLTTPLGGGNVTPKKCAASPSRHSNTDVRQHQLSVEEHAGCG